MNLWDRITLFVATGFGLGLVSPFAPGTFGSLPGVALAYAVCALPLYMQLPACLGCVLLAIPVCDRAEKLLGIKDDGRISADEWLLYPMALVGIPLATLPWWSMAIFFAVVRLIDIAKPWPCRGLQRITGGRGIVIDDFVANLYALVINWLIYLVVWGCK
ncbi:MAG: phosphatidylglycerophosphatase A [Kiritimatiellae bacterium]|nr:phosphatidylglycerophosphatase A [Kiritimatiellia bacterium]